MTNITNRHGLPQALVRALQRDGYSRGHSRFSVTQLIDSPRVRWLRENNAASIERDVSDSVWSLFGRAVHHILETGADQSEHIVEERMFATVHGTVISGQVDVLDRGFCAEMLDWKVTTTMTLRSPERLDKWEKQLNSYCALRRISHIQTGGREPTPVTSLLVVAFLRDWSKGRARDADYPKSPIVPIPLRMWTDQAQDDFLRECVIRHMEAEVELPLCTDEDRWKRRGGYEIVQITKEGKEWVREKFSGATAEIDAVQKMNANIAASKRPIDTWVREIEALPIRCMEWCEVSQFCSQWAAERGSAPTDPLSTSTNQQEPTTGEGDMAHGAA